ncbi:hypothetical protein NM688_g4104 [Phlebia brevispora]|uniref:Uncharacterized protein n=1 Tax=Phlebia brevispora TaxID=194682 RepID=A0ACC1T433_9APHY|nr:hypothetical protein NM688_g4104 [Phlebia brevispora]
MVLFAISLDDHDNQEAVSSTILTACRRQKVVVERWDNETRSPDLLLPTVSRGCTRSAAGSRQQAQALTQKQVHDDSTLTGPQLWCLHHHAIRTLSSAAV